MTVKITDGQRKPNKAILLLAVIDLIRCGYIIDNKIPLDKTIELSFNRMWELYVGTPVPSCWTPFWHLKTEEFWHFMPKNQGLDVNNLAPPGQTAPIGKMRNAINYAYLSNDLYDLILDKSSRNIIISTLLQSYLK